VEGSQGAVEPVPAKMDAEQKPLSTTGSESVAAGPDAGQEESLIEDGASTPGVDSNAGPSGESSGSRTDGERAAALEDELQESLAEFDGLLLREQEMLAERRSGGGEGTQGGGGGSGGSDGGASGTSEAEAAESPQGESSSAVAEAGGAGSSKPDSGEVASGVTSGPIPPDVGDGSDDDIVARQLREAAMKEEDPELREKLWQEYREYKSSSKDSD
jgi:hypothetical protein